MRCVLIHAFPLPPLSDGSLVGMRYEWTRRLSTALSLPYCESVTRTLYCLYLSSKYSAIAAVQFCSDMASGTFYYPHIKIDPEVMGVSADLVLIAQGIIEEAEAPKCTSILSFVCVRLLQGSRYMPVEATRQLAMELLVPCLLYTSPSPRDRG